MDEDDDAPPMLVTADGSAIEESLRSEEPQAKKVPITIITGR
jgi:hypothetical protein